MQSNTVQNFHNKPSIFHIFGIYISSFVTTGNYGTGIDVKNSKLCSLNFKDKKDSVESLNFNFKFFLIVLKILWRYF